LRKSKIRPQRGFNVYGYLSARLGLGEAARNLVQVMIARGDAFAAADIMPPAGLSHEELDEGWPLVECAKDLHYSVNIFHINPPEYRWIEAHGSIPLSALRGRTLNAMVPFWELPRMPDSWVSTLNAMDVVLAPTHYIADCAHQSGVESPVVHLPQAVHPPAEVRADRAKWNLPNDATSFVCMFDMLSDAERKNPWGAVDAFRSAFEGRDDVRLTIKANNVHSPQAKADWRDRLLSLQEDSRVRVIDESLSRADMWSLYASADVYVSLHRAEGLGLGLLEAMAVGTPVIATGYSGNMDFMDESNSIPIPYSLVPATSASIKAYEGNCAEQLWAEPDLAAAVAAMKSLADDRTRLRDLGERARQAALEVQRVQQRGAALDHLLGLWDSGAFPTRDSVRSLARQRREQRLIRFKRSVVLSMRTLGLKPPRPPEEIAEELAAIEAAKNKTSPLGILDRETRRRLAARTGR